MPKKMTKKDLALLRKALAVSADPNDSDISAYLPAPLATQVIDHIRDLTIVRRLWNVFPMSARVWKKPKRASGSSAYYIPDGVVATESGFTSTTKTWTAKKLMVYTSIDEEAIEDSQPDVVQQILGDFAEAIAEAEEKAFLQGDTTHTATAPDPGSATTANWYIRDPRLAFDGIFTLAGASGAATSVDAASSAFDPEMVNHALYNLGKYGRNKSDVLGFVPSEQASNIRANTSWHDASKTGLALASFISGLGSAGERDSLVTVVYGVNFYEAPFAPSGKVVMYWRRNPQIGDRRRIKFANDVVIEQDQRKYVVSERIAFGVDYEDALVLIKNLSTTIVS